MTDSRPISCLVATDLSSRSDRALVRAFRLAGRGGGRVIALHVVEEDYPRRLSDTLAKEIETELRRQISSMPEAKDVHWSIEVERGHDHERIAEMARRHSVDMLVMGGRREPKLSDLFLASTAQRVVRQAPVPVLVVKNPYRGPYETAVAAVDASVHCRDAISFAWSSFPEVFVSAFYAKSGPGIPALADDLPPERSSLQPGETETIQAPLTAMPDFARRGDFTVLAGDPTQALRGFVREKRPDLLICGRSKSARSFFLGEDLPGYAMLTVDRDILIMP